MNGLIPTFVLFVSAIASPVGIISFVLKATTMQWGCCVLHIMWISLKHIPLYLLLALFSFILKKKNPQHSEGIFNTVYSSGRVAF